MEDGSRVRPSIVIADDEEDVRCLVRQALEPLDSQVWEAGSGREVLRIMEKRPADVVILDLVMPEMEGLETLQLLRTRMPRSKILVISGAFGGGFLNCARLLGAQAALKKPFSCASLLAEVEALLAT
jgi:CheY-like chemotaxis protein